MQHFALTIIGRDRPGIVSQVTEILYTLGFNIADSSSPPPKSAARKNFLTSSQCSKKATCRSSSER